MIQPAAYRILYCYLTSDVQSFSQLCKQAGYPTDLGGYYIRQLVDGGYLAKIDRGQYGITPKGKQLMATAYGKRPFAVRPRLTVLLVPKQGDKYVLIKRARQPFMGVTEWPAGAVHFGEGLPEASARILGQRLNVEGSPAFRGFFRRTDFYQSNDTVFDDKLFAVHAVGLKNEQQIAVPAPDDVVLCTAEELTALPHPAKSLLDIHAFTQADTPAYKEHQYMLTEQDLSV